MRSRITAALALAALAVPLAAHADGDAAAGKAIFHRCMLCHSPEKGVNKIGPSLFGIVGRPAASLPTYHYSDALQGLKAKNTVWTPVNLNQWLTKPQDMAPGTKMIFPGLPSATDRQNVIAYLETLK